MDLNQWGEVWSGFKQVLFFLFVFFLGTTVRVQIGSKGFSSGLDRFPVTNIWFWCPHTWLEVPQGLKTSSVATNQQCISSGLTINTHNMTKDGQTSHEKHLILSPQTCCECSRLQFFVDTNKAGNVSQPPLKISGVDRNKYGWKCPKVSLKSPSFVTTNTTGVAPGLL